MTTWKGRYDLANARARVNRWLTDSVHETSKTARMVRQLAAGETVPNYGPEAATANYAAQTLRRAGYTVVTRRGVGFTAPQGLTPHGDVSQNGNGHVPVPPTSRPGDAVWPHPASPAESRPLAHPMVGGVLRVQAVVLNDGALELLALDDDGRAWQLGIIGATA